jgi:hypothetical protein
MATTGRTQRQIAHKEYRYEHGAERSMCDVRKLFAYHQQCPARRKLADRDRSHDRGRMADAIG